MSSIPASYAVQVQPNVLPAGGSALDLIGLFLTDSTRPPIGSILSFPGVLEVEDYFGGGSKEVAEATVYFAGFDNSNVKPGSVLFAQYPTGAVAAYLRGGDVSGLTLTELQAINGTLNVTIDGTPQTGAVNLSGATSFSNAAQSIQVSLGISGQQQAQVAGTIAGSVLTVISVDNGAIEVGQEITGTDVAVGTFIQSFGTGTGGAGTYNLSVASTVGSSEQINVFAPAVTYDSVSGAFKIISSTLGAASTIGFCSGAAATSLALTQAAGAVVSPGSDAAVPSTFMNAIVNQTTNWASFGTTFDPDGGSGYANKLLFAQWNATQNKRYVYVPFDTSTIPATQTDATDCLMAHVEALNIDGVAGVWEDDDSKNTSAFTMGSIASIDFTEPNGRITFAFRSQSGLAPSVTDLQTAINLGGDPLIGGRGNGYNFYGAFAGANQNFQDYQRGFVSGQYLWLDSYVNQIWLNNQFQLDLYTLLRNTKSIPYNSAGNAIIEASLADTIQQGLSFGAYRAGVTLSAAQIAEVNARAPAGQNIAATLQNQGWYLLIGTATPQVRQRRGSPPMTFFYVDGQAVQAINLVSVSLQ